MGFVFRLRSVLLISAMALSCFAAAQNAAGQAYLGLDRNEYPGDANMQALRKTFAFTGYWLNNPPGADRNSWKGKRASLQGIGYGFLILFNGRVYMDLKASGDAAGVGAGDAVAAVQAASAEGFPKKTIIFLDQEQGGRMLPEQKAYIYAWVDGVVAAGFRAGIYCSGQVSPDEQHVVTMLDIRQSAGTREITYWAINDACPPAPGCTFPAHPPSPTQSGIDFAEVWQFAQSPQRKDVAAHCNGYNHDGGCYPPGTTAAQGLHVDVSVATSNDPSHARTDQESASH